MAHCFQLGRIVKLGWYLSPGLGFHVLTRFHTETKFHINSQLLSLHTDTTHFYSETLLLEKICSKEII